MQHCLIVASSTAAVTDLCSALTSARLEPVAADVASLALLRAELACYPAEADDDRLHALVDIGANDITLVLHRDGDPRFIRAIPQLAGEKVVAGLADRLALAVPDAVAVLAQTGLNGPPPVVAPVAESSVFAALAPSGAAALDPRTSTALTVIGPWATSLVGSIRDSLDYFQAGAGRGEVRDIRITGRLAGLAGLRERMTTELRLPVHILDTGSRLSWSRRAAKTDPATLSLAVGLALRGRP